MHDWYCCVLPVGYCCVLHAGGFVACRPLCTAQLMPNRGASCRSAGTAASSSAATAAPEVRLPCACLPSLRLWPLWRVLSRGEVRSAARPRGVITTACPWSRPPAAYHADCLGLVDAEVQAAKRWMCPQHACAICQRGANVRGRVAAGCGGMAGCRVCAAVQAAPAAAQCLLQRTAACSSCPS